MRIAIVGAHATGKSTLVAALAARWPGHVAVDEAFYDLESTGIDASEPTVDTLEPQLLRSLELLRQPDLPNAIFDRSPLDYLAYLRCLEPDWDLASYLDPVRRALTSLELLVFVPIEVPDRVQIGAAEFPRLRKQVDRLLRTAAIDDAWGVGATGFEVTGSVASRVAQVEARVARVSGPS